MTDPRSLSLMLLLVLAPALHAMTMADLDALVAQQSYQEALDRATDVAPAARDAAWRAAVIKAATGALASAGDLVALEAQLKQRYAFVLDDPAYAAASLAPALKTAEECIAQSWGDVDYCIKDLQGRQLSPAGAIAAAEVVARGSNARNAIGLLWRAVEKDPVHCKHERAQDITLGALATPQSPDRELAVKVATACFDPMREALLEALAESGDGGYVGAAICPLLVERKALSGLQLRRCEARQ